MELLIDGVGVEITQEVRDYVETKLSDITLPVLSVEGLVISVLLVYRKDADIPFSCTISFRNRTPGRGKKQVNRNFKKIANSLNDAIDGSVQKFGQKLPGLI